jgi:hypothetical protein
MKQHAPSRSEPGCQAQSRWDQGRKADANMVYRLTVECVSGACKRAGFLNMPVHAVPIQRRFASTAEAIGRMRNSAGDLKEVTIKRGGS